VPHAEPDIVKQEPPILPNPGNRSMTDRCLLPRRAYVVSQFPEFCETFILNEMVELGRRGAPFEIFSLKACRDAQFQPGARELMENATHYCPPVYHPSVIWSHLTAAARRPAVYFSTFLLALRAFAGPSHVLAKTLYVFCQAAWFARIARRRGLAHVHAHWASIPSSAGLFIARLAGATFSLTAHAYDIFIDRTLLREKLHAARYVITCTRYNRRFLLDTYPDVPPEKIRAIYHGVDLSAFTGRRDPAQEEPVILSVGRLCDTKGFPDLIDACALLRERGLRFSCRIVGDGYMREELEARIRQRGLEDWVEIAGLLPRVDVIERYRRARLFVLPCVVTPRGDRDGLPNVVIEAMAMGLPVVATDVSALPEAVEDGVTGRLVTSHAPEAIADAVEDLWRNGPLRARMGAEGVRRVRERFALEDNIEKLAAFVHERDGGVGD
jgi:glycosyltransferase involved in cell wall biosynthesis